MLKTSNTKSAEPRKGVVGDGDGGRYRAEPVGRHEVDGGNNDGGDCNGDSDRNSSDAPKLMCLSTPLILRLKTSSSTDLSTSATQIAVKYDEFDGGKSGAVGKSIKKSSKS